MKKFYIAPEANVEKIQVENMIALSVISDHHADQNSGALVKGDADFSETSGSRGNAWSDQW